ncbi:tRNA (adenosine(37)-N6)-threonylcarbamoyltransferase complex ATPase subunit type 1 TsaE [Phyllobacterium sp. SYP-B3895]|uniref:tRNA (adenosine(37)-N6)-threonylcarbamoyltransferase complex ATPase subunit type 1 TsaE n=1 Tax=Phyllobacterium sp. SYP-B3895 TaxID=2663240 RepID=UPI001299B024|nr:tRNA (adenosine(37)-N6)-threonylcarbamoyltransferase complex ATPase subunit type 1 TsaE [Phyllobacterium sp. SYP-B3895]MRG54692.1 tRNA (adenosine(37)-N6)-threonylcarbamoyltransferase complex ATPase subunit type 1 TsaE [Phyllobacterium sp. SYP-B3895]
MAPIIVQLATTEDTERFGQDLALALRKGDLVALSGDLGAGKSTLARGLIRTIAADNDYEVPSPTFTLVQSYPELRLPVSHVDLYRLSAAEEVDELGLEEALEDGVVLVEWPERAAGALPRENLHIELTHVGEGREVRIDGDAAALARVERSLAIRAFLASSGFAKAERRYLLGDASARSYETIANDGQSPLILMNSPYNPGGPILRDGKTYMEIAHLSQSVTAFVAIDKLLQANGFSVPEIHAADLDAGFLITENLGSEGILDAEGLPVLARYEAAVRLLARLHQFSWPQDIEAADGYAHHIHRFDRDAMMIEVELLSEWYVPRMRDATLPQELKQDYVAKWDEVFSQLKDAEQSLLLRDVHAPNILWRADRKGMERVGLIDFQDAMIGPSAYDVASLVLDARVTISPELQDHLLLAYLAERRAADPKFDEANFRKAFAIMAAQRNAKILGIFVRLDERDGKPAYLKHLPRIHAYFIRALQHEALAPIRNWCEKVGILDPEFH